MSCETVSKMFSSSLSSRDALTPHVPSTFQCEKLHVQKWFTNEVSKNLWYGLWLTPTSRLHKTLAIVIGSWKLQRAFLVKGLIVCYKFCVPYPWKRKSLERNSFEKTIPRKVTLLMGSMKLSGMEEKELLRETDVLPLDNEKTGGLLSLLPWRTGSWNNGSLSGPELWPGRRY